MALGASNNNNNMAIPRPKRICQFQ